ncbi:MAG: hypothetical protein ACKON8_04870, partial [Planctomycetota bacterium]
MLIGPFVPRTGSLDAVTPGPVAQEPGVEIAERPLTDAPESVRGEFHAAVALLDEPRLLELPGELGELLERPGRVVTEQRAQLQELANALLDDMDLSWQVDRLGRNLRDAFPRMGWDRGMPFNGDEPMPLEAMGGVLDELADLDALENLLRDATNPGPLAEVDLDKVRDLLGERTGVRRVAQQVLERVEVSELVEHPAHRLERHRLVAVER